MEKKISSREEKNEVTSRFIPSCSNPVRLVEFDRCKVRASSTKDTHRLYMEKEQLSVRCWMTVKVSIRELRAGSFAKVSVTSDIGAESSCIRWRIGPGTSVDHRSCSLTLFEKQWRSFQIREIRIGGKFAGSSSARNKRVFSFSFFFFQIENDNSIFFIG